MLLGDAALARRRGTMSELRKTLQTGTPDDATSSPSERPSSSVGGQFVEKDFVPPPPGS
jgi:hypothetical protein